MTGPKTYINNTTLMKPSYLLFLVFLFVGCSGTPELAPQSYDPPGAVDTRDKPITRQVRQAYAFEEEGVYMTNDFAGSRLIEPERTGVGTYTATITPENAPINNSAWYAFKAWATGEQDIELTLRYVDGTHRYWPKVSRDGASWTPLDSSAVVVTDDKAQATLSLTVGPDTVWVAGQELVTNAVMDAWQFGLSSEKSFIKTTTIGTSRAGRALYLLDIAETESPEAYVLVIGRQHPPEIPGALALMPFVETLSADTELARAFRQRFAVWVVPVVNPDGVAEGHWRHNLGGIDLNRDWHSFNQPETRAVRDRFLQLKEAGTPVLAAFDFHSTQYDVMYTLDRELHTIPPGFTDAWLAAIEAKVPGYVIRDEPFGLGSPVSKNWFYETFQTPSVTYEVGDNTDRALLREVAIAAAESVMELALEK